MTGSELQRTIEKICEAHGGIDRWRKLEAVEAVISVGGFLFKAKRRPALSRVRVRAAIRKPEFTFYDYPGPGRNSVFMGNEEVRITDAGHQVLVSRQQPRVAIRRLRRQLYWDALDFTYFGGYATWNYLVTPFLFSGDGFKIDMLEPQSTDPDYPVKLQVDFPPDFPSHCRRQIFYFDRDYLLRRLDYTAEVVSRWARAAHTCKNYREFDGIKFPTKRRVRPLLIGQKLLARPVIVAIDIHEMHLKKTAL
ncbi:hypothetical protein JY97_04155 [Alkalispirochaeta odontotermitis]|nr:hypothetical protein JY97_04155 [Alkalispirochaeta odontotermitis]CAB1075321.1 hypothetical protein D1AOALGA4SA_3141 [Olavius algarvensis Delta 1 endosymbiont]